MSGSTVYIDLGTSSVAALVHRQGQSPQAIIMGGLARVPLTVFDTEADLPGRQVAALRAVLAAATTEAGEPVPRVVMVVAAHRGPRWRTELRHLGQQAGVTVADIVDGPAAVATHLARTDASLVGRTIVIGDLGASAMEAAVYDTSPDPVNLQAIVDTLTGGDTIDEAIVTHSGAGSVVDARAAKHALALRYATKIPSTDGGAIDFDQPLLLDAAGTIWDEYAAIVEQAVFAAGLSIDQVGGLYLIGGGALLPMASDSLRARLALAVTVCPEPDRAAVTATTQTMSPLAAPTTVESASPSKTPTFATALNILIPGVGSLALFYQFLTAAVAYPETGQVIAPWGNLAMSAILAVATALTAANAIVAPARSAPVALGSWRAPLVTAASITGVAIAAVYGLGAQAYIGLDANYLKVTLIAALPVAVVSVALVHLSQYIRPTAVPLPRIVSARTMSVALTAAGAFAAQAGLFGTIGATQVLWTLLIHIGGALIGAGFAMLAGTRRMTRLYLIPACALLGLLVIGLGSANTFGYLYVAALTIWILVRESFIAGLLRPRRELPSRLDLDQ